MTILIYNEKCEPAEEAISPDEGDLRLGRRLLALASPWRTDLDFVMVELYLEEA